MTNQSNPQQFIGKGYVHLYFGDGKGKTTAALGLALRSMGAGLRVFLGQFVKGMTYSEIKALDRFSDLVTVRQYGLDCFIYNEPTKEDIRVARKGLSEVSRILKEGSYQLVILDEINIALYYNLFSVTEVLDLLKSRHWGVEVVLTGRKPDPVLIDYADLVTEMQEVKHYYRKGIEARSGIES